MNDILTFLAMRRVIHTTKKVSTTMVTFLRLVTTTCTVILVMEAINLVIKITKNSTDIIMTMDISIVVSLVSAMVIVMVVTDTVVMEVMDMSIIAMAMEVTGMVTGHTITDMATPTSSAKSGRRSKRWPMLSRTPNKRTRTSLILHRINYIPT